MIILGIILGIILAAGFSFMITMLIVKNSNDMGNSKATFKNFSQSLHIISKRDGVNPSGWNK